MDECSAYVVPDVHEDTVAVALPGRGEAVCRGEIENQRSGDVRGPAARRRLMRSAARCYPPIPSRNTGGAHS